MIIAMYISLATINFPPKKCGEKAQDARLADFFAEGMLMQEIVDSEKGLMEAGGRGSFQAETKR